VSRHGLARDRFQPGRATAHLRKWARGSLLRRDTGRVRPFDLPQTGDDSVILKDLRVRGMVAAGALLMAAACGGGDETDAAATPAAGDSAAPSATAAAPNAAQQPAAPHPNVAAALDSAMTPAQAAEAAESAAPAPGPVTVQAIASYQLTLPRLRTLVKAGQNIAALQAERPDLRDSMRIPTMDPNLLFQKLNTIPAAREAVTRAGITPREYALATSALIQATMVNEMRRRGQTPEGEFNEANVKFVADNEEAIKEIMRAAAPAPPSGQRQN
jgi:hypothetical protein